MNRETELRLLISELQELELSVADALRELADSLERGELLMQGTGRRIGAIISRVEASGTKLLRIIERKGADISNVRTTEDMAELCDQLGSERRLLALDAIQYVTATEEKYAAPLEELQDRAAQAGGSLSAEGGRLSEDGRRTADQAQAVLEALNTEDSDKSALADLGISDTIVLGLTRGKYRIDEPAGDEKDRARQQEILRSVNQALAHGQKSEAESVDVLEAAEVFGNTVRPLSKLRNSKPNAQRFLSDLNACGSFADIIAGMAVFEDVLTVQFVIDKFEAEDDNPLSPGTENEIRKTMRRLVRRGILAAYRVGGMVVYILTRFAFESMKLPEVQRAMALDFPYSSKHLEIVARKEMPEPVLILAWMRNSMRVKLDNWYRKETGRGMADAVDTGSSEDEELGLRLPESYGRADERFMIRPYELPRAEQPGPVLYVAVTNDIVPLEADIDEEEGSLLLYDGELYERRDGLWVLLERTSPDGAKRPPLS